MVLFALGAGLGLMLARGLILLAPLVVTVPKAIADGVTLDWRVLTFVTALSFVAALASGLVPAFKGSKADPVTWLKEDTRSTSGRSRIRGAFVVAQIAFSILVVVLAGLFVRALRHAGAASPGFDPRGVEIATLDLSMSGDNDPTSVSFWRSLIERVRQVPGVETASLVRVPPGGWEGIGLGGVSAGPTAASSDVLSPAWNIVDSGYFRTLRIPFVSGRDFSSSDVAGGPPVAIVADGVGRRLWPGQNAAGKYLTIHGFNFQTQKTETRSVLVVGAVGDIKSSSLIDGLAEPYVYLPLEQFREPGFTAEMSIVARSAGANRLAPTVGAVVGALNPNLVVVKTETMQQSIAYGLTPQRWLAAIAGTFGLVGLLLAAVGIYGLVAYTVESRRKEFGIRMALGARRVQIVWMVLRQGMVFVGAGAIVGLSLATGAGEVLSVFLYGLPAIHVPTFLGALVLFAAVAAMACYLPARQAIGADPARALRNE
jgi:predicted permease